MKIGGQAYGLSKREYYAAKALQGLLSGHPDADCEPSGYAHDAVLMADALIAALARSKKQNERKM